MAFNATRFVDDAVTKIQENVGKNTALCATSGGVDSMVCAFLAHRALGKNLIAVFIDDGLMRENEPRMVTTILRKHGIRTVMVSAASDFFKALKGKEDPE